jgi:uncharacterized membrane protein
MEKKLVRCKACGFIMSEGAYHSCPACGVPEKMFEPFDDKIPEARRKVLELHIHPIIVHAPQALGFLILLMSVTYMVLSQWFPGGEIASYVVITLKVLSVILPVLVVGGFMSGLLDGMYRYKTVSSPLLVRKMIIGTSFFVVSLLMAAVIFQPAFSSELGVQILYLGLSLLAFLCTAMLGKWGASLVGGIMPGPFVKKKKKLD